MNKIEHTISNSPEYKQGQFYLNSQDGHTYILAQTQTQKYQLISLNGGNRYCEPSPTEKMAFAGDFSEFSLVANTFAVTPNI